ncbi:type IV pilin protein [Maricurvus nonylphenolicus]|uniref:type IV pilin protein n=1 Tax=Maricurvus nonylphenolicus TaxID=1008307 RepID=UPI0036F1F9C6
MKNKKKFHGFSLIEMLIVVAIIGIAGAAAYAAYTEQVSRGMRTEGKDFILDLAAAQEAFYAQNLSYANSITAANQLNRMDTQSANGRYTANLVVAPGGCAAGVTACRTYTLSVVPNTVDLDCTSLTYNNAGVVGSTGAGTVAECWR